MRIPRFATVVTLLVLLLAVALAPSQVSRAQEATPDTGTPEAAVEPEFHYLAGVALEGLPYTPAVLNVMGATFAPGSMTPSGPDPYAVFIYVESGTITLLAEDAVTVFEDGLAGPGVPGEQADPGEPTDVPAGGAFLVLPGVPYQVSNATGAPAEVVLLLFLPPTEEGDIIPAASPVA